MINSKITITNNTSRTKMKSERKKIVYGFQCPSEQAKKDLQKKINLYSIQHEMEVFDIIDKAVDILIKNSK